MPQTYCKEFQDYFNSENLPFPESFSKKISELIKFHSSGKHSLCTGFEELFDEFLSKGIKPFHLGLGNPNAKILIVGKEIAISTKKTNPKQLATSGCTNSNYYYDLFVNEAILNYFLWAYKVMGNHIPANCCIQDPEFASSFCHLYNQEKNGGHYWAKLNTAVGNSLEKNLDFKTNQHEESFFKDVFLTELHGTPSLQSPINPDRISIVNKFNDLSQVPFFKKFDRIVFSCNTYLRREIPQLDSVIENNYKVTLVQKKLSRNIRALYESQNIKIILCNNLAGAAGWSNNELKTLGDILK